MKKKSLKISSSQNSLSTNTQKLGNISLQQTPITQNSPFRLSGSQSNINLYSNSDRKSKKGHIKNSQSYNQYFSQNQTPQNLSYNLNNQYGDSIISNFQTPVGSKNSHKKKINLKQSQQNQEINGLLSPKSPQKSIKYDIKQILHKEKQDQQIKVNKVFNTIKDINDKQDIVRAMKQLQNIQERQMLIDKIMIRKIEKQDADQFVKLTQNASLINRFIRKLKTPSEGIQNLQMDKYIDKNKQKAYIVDSFSNIKKMERRNSLKVNQQQLPVEMASSVQVQKTSDFLKNDKKQNNEMVFEVDAQQEETITNKQSLKQLGVKSNNKKMTFQNILENQDSLENSENKLAQSKEYDQKQKPSIRVSQFNDQQQQKLQENINQQEEKKQDINENNSNQNINLGSRDSLNTNGDKKKEFLNILESQNDKRRRSSRLQIMMQSSRQKKDSFDFNMKLLNHPLMKQMTGDNFQNTEFGQKKQEDSQEKEQERIQFMKEYLQKSYWQKALWAFKDVKTDFKQQPKEIEEYYKFVNGKKVKKVRYKQALPSQLRDDSSHSKEEGGQMLSLNFKKVSDKSQALMELGKQKEKEKTVSLLKEAQKEGLAAHFKSKFVQNKYHHKQEDNKIKKENCQKLNTFQQKDNNKSANYLQTCDYFENKRAFQDVVVKEVFHFLASDDNELQNDHYLSYHTNIINEIEKDAIFKLQNLQKYKKMEGNLSNIKKVLESTKINSMSNLEPRKSVIQQHEFGGPEYKTFYTEQKKKIESSSYSSPQNKNINFFLQNSANNKNKQEDQKKMTKLQEKKNNLILNNIQMNVNQQQYAQKSSQNKRHFKHIITPQTSTSVPRLRRNINLEILQDDESSQGDGNDSYASYTEIKLDQLYMDSQDTDKKIKYLDQMNLGQTAMSHHQVKLRNSFNKNQMQDSKHNNNIFKHKLDDAYKKQKLERRKIECLINEAVKRKLKGGISQQVMSSEAMHKKEDFN